MHSSAALIDSPSARVAQGFDPIIDVPRHLQQEPLGPIPRHRRARFVAPLLIFLCNVAIFIVGLAATEYEREYKSTMEKFLWVIWSYPRIPNYSFIALVCNLPVVGVRIDRIRQSSEFQAYSSKTSTR
jgi:hypothetical protein